MIERASDSSDDSSDSAELDATQQASQLVSETFNDCELDELWGYLIPIASGGNQLNFARTNRKYKIGRIRDKNNYVLPSALISGVHCEIQWNGMEFPGSVVTVADLSSNGTFINGILIGRSKRVVMHDGDTLIFGTLKTEDLGNRHFIYRHLAAPRQGLAKDYRLLGEIGKGAFGTVMKASHRVNGGWYAVKVIDANNARHSTTAQPSFDAIREIQILAQLQHRNICQMKEVFMESNTINLVLELVEGGNLFEYIRQRHGLEERKAQPIAAQICDAVAYMHSLGIAHRDLKPANILLTTDDPPIVKVADFGLSKILDDSTMLRTLCGTPTYLAPEVIQGQGDQGYGLVVDSWSLGAIIFSMLTGCDPYVQNNRAADLVGRILNRQVNWPILGEAGVTSIAHHLLSRLLEVNPMHRMTSAEALKHAWFAEDMQGPSAISAASTDALDNSNDPPLGSQTFVALPVPSPTMQNAVTPRAKRRMPGQKPVQEAIRRSSRLRILKLGGKAK